MLDLYRGLLTMNIQPVFSEIYIGLRSAVKKNIGESLGKYKSSVSQRQHASFTSNRLLYTPRLSDEDVQLKSCLNKRRVFTGCFF